MEKTYWFRRPFWLIAVGLALMVGGYQLGRHVPLSPREREQTDRLAGLKTQTDDVELRERLDDVGRNNRREPPYRWPGLLVTFVGGMLCVSGGMKMFRQPPREEVPEEEDGGEESA